MKHILISLALMVSVFAPIRAQYKNPGDEKLLMNNQFELNVHTINYESNKLKLQQFIQRKKFEIISQNENESRINIQFRAKESELDSIEKLMRPMGYVSVLNKVTRNDYRLVENELEIKKLMDKKAEYEQMLKRMDSINAPNYYTHWEKIREIDESIYQLKKFQNQLNNIGDDYLADIILINDQTTPLSSGIDFVHMPGVEYVHFITENPLPGLSYAQYQGVSLKYLFTTGKSYFSLGALKAVKNGVTDSTAYDEMFTFTFGQDWYSRHFGRGANRFFNLYIGYQTGLTLAYNQRNIDWIPYVSPSTGLELFKNKYLLIDINVNYYLPISDVNRYLRGWRLGGSFNFSF